VSDEDVTQDRLRIGGWLPPYDVQAHDGPAPPPTTALSGEVVDRIPRSAPPARSRAQRTAGGRTARRALLAGVGAAVVVGLFMLWPISRNGAPPTRAQDGPRVTAVPEASSSSAPASPGPDASSPTAEPSPTAVNLTANPPAAPVTNPTTAAPTTPGGATRTAAPAPTPAPTGGPIMSGTRLSLEPATDPGYRVRHQNFVGRVDPISSAADRADATFTVRVGLADSRCVSFESVNYPGHFLRHQNFRAYLHRADGTQLFRADATFCAVSGLAGQYTSLRSYNYPDRYLRHRDRVLYLDPYDGRGQTAYAMTFAVRTGLA
jgi:hypothetical protein